MTTLHRDYLESLYSSQVKTLDVYEVTNGGDRSRRTLYDAGTPPGRVNDLSQTASVVVQQHQPDVSGVA